MDEFESEAELEVATKKGIAYLYWKNLYENRSIQNVSIIKDKSIDIEQAKEFLLSTIKGDNIKKVVIIQDRFNDVNQAKLFLESILNETKINDVIIKSDDPKTYLMDILNNQGINTVNILSKKDELNKAILYLNNLISNNSIKKVEIKEIPDLIDISGLSLDIHVNPSTSSTFDISSINPENAMFPLTGYSFDFHTPEIPKKSNYISTLAYENPGDLSWDISDDILDKYIYWFQTEKI